MTMFEGIHGTLPLPCTDGQKERYRHLVTAILGDHPLREYYSVKHGWLYCLSHFGKGRSDSGPPAAYMYTTHQKCALGSRFLQVLFG